MSRSVKVVNFEKGRTDGQLEISVGEPRGSILDQDLHFRQSLVISRLRAYIYELIKKGIIIHFWVMITFRFSEKICIYSNLSLFFNFFPGTCMIHPDMALNTQLYLNYNSGLVTNCHIFITYCMYTILKFPPNFQTFLTQFNEFNDLQGPDLTLQCVFVFRTDENVFYDPDIFNASNRK